MMKKLVIGICVATMAFAMASSAFAALNPGADTAWRVYLRAETAGVGSNAIVGTKVGSTVDNAVKGSEDATWPDPQPVTTIQPNIVSFSQIGATDLRNATATEQVWNIKIWNPFNVEKDVTLMFWNPSGGIDVDVTEQIDLWVGGEKVYTLDTTKNGTQGAATAQWVSANPYKIAAGGYLDAKIVANAVPEPGSIVAMLSGLVGLVGFGIRRRQ